MRSNVRKPIVDSILITLLAAILVWVAPSSSAARTTRGSHPRARNAVTPPSGRAAGEAVTAEALKRQNEILAGLQVSQSALEKAATDSNTAIQRGLTQLTVNVADSEKQTQQSLEATNQRLNSMRRWLKSVVLFFFLSMGGLFYMIFRPDGVQDNSFRRRGRAPAMTPAGDEVVRWQSGEPANGPGRSLGIGRDRELPSAR